MRLQIVLLVVAAAVLATTEAVSAMDSNGLQMVSPNAPLQTHADEGKRLLRSETVDEDDDVSEDDEDESEDDEDERMNFSFKAKESAQASNLKNSNMGEQYKQFLAQRGNYESLAKAKKLGNAGEVSKLNSEKDTLRQILRKKFTDEEIILFKYDIARDLNPGTRSRMTVRGIQHPLMPSKEVERFTSFYNDMLKFTLKDIENKKDVIKNLSPGEIEVFNGWITKGGTPESYVHELRLQETTRANFGDSEKFRPYYDTVVDLMKRKTDSL